MLFLISVLNLFAHKYDIILVLGLTGTCIYSSFHIIFIDIINLQYVNSNLKGDLIFFKANYFSIFQIPEIQNVKLSKFSTMNNIL